MDPSTWTIRDPTISARGAKSCMLEDMSREDRKIRFTLGSKDSPIQTPFGATTYNNEEAKRQTVEFFLDSEQENEFQGVVEWAHVYLATHSDRLFRKTMTPDQVAECFRSPVTRKDKYRPHVRCKIDTNGRYAVRCWDAEGNRRDLPSDLRGLQMVPRVLLSHLWCMSRECGLVLLVTDLMILDSGSDVCPFL